MWAFPELSGKSCQTGASAGGWQARAEGPPLPWRRRWGPARSSSQASGAQGAVIVRRPAVPRKKPRVGPPTGPGESSLPFVAEGKQGRCWAGSGLKRWVGVRAGWQRPLGLTPGPEKAGRAGGLPNLHLRVTAPGGLGRARTKEGAWPGVRNRGPCRPRGWGMAGLCAGVGGP